MLYYMYEGVFMRNKIKNKVKDAGRIGDIVYTNILVLPIAIAIIVRQQYDEYKQNKKTNKADN